MINLDAFIKECEKDLVSKQSLSKEVMALVSSLSDKNKILCKPILTFVTRDLIKIEFSPKEVEFLPDERALVCRLIPLYFKLDTSQPAWSSNMLTQAIKSATNVKGIKLSEIGTAFLEILSENAVPLNNVITNFCIDLSREFTVHYRERLNEFEPLLSWNNLNGESNSSAAFLRYGLAPIDGYQPKFILKTMIELSKSESFGEFITMNKYLFEDKAYEQEFLEYLAESNLSKNKKDLIVSIIRSV